MKTVKPTRAERRKRISLVGSRSNRKSTIRTIVVFVAPIKRPAGEQTECEGTVSGCEIDDDQKSTEDHHGALKQINKGPLRLVVRIDHAERPCRSQAINEILQCRSPRTAWQRCVGV